MKRIFLFLATNVAVMLLLTLTVSVLGIDRMIGGNLTGMIVMAGLLGFGGAFISLLLSKSMTKRAMGVYVIETPANATERWLVDTVARQARQAGIGMPEVGIFDIPGINAFATGWSKDHALVAVSTGLLNNMSQEEAEAVLGHEVSHVANGDMVTLTLIQGVVNTFVFFFAWIIGSIIDRVVLRQESSHGFGFSLGTFIAQILLGALASLIVAWFSRWREFRADAGGAALAGRQKMIAALQRLKMNYGVPAVLPDEAKAFGIFGITAEGWERLKATHPPLDERIAALQSAQ